MDSFLVQVWVPADGAPGRTGLRGVVRHVATGTETAFRNEEEVLEALRCATDHRPPAPPDRAQGQSIVKEGDR